MFRRKTLLNGLKCCIITCQNFIATVISHKLFIMSGNGFISDLFFFSIYRWKNSVLSLTNTFSDI